LSFGKVLIDGFLREVVELIIVAFVAEEGGIERAGAKFVFPLLGEEVVKGFAAGVEGLWWSLGV